MRSSCSSRPVRPAHGRVLIECCVAVVLLAGGSSLLLLCTSATAVLADGARQHDVVLRATATRLAALHAAPCANGPLSRRETVGPRTVVALTASTHGTVRTGQVETWWQPSARTGMGRQYHAIASAARCE